MSEIEKEYLQKARNILTSKRFYKGDENHGDRTPVNSKLLNIIPNGVIVLSEEVYQVLLKVHALTRSEEKEVPFFLYGKEIDNNKIYFDDFFSKSNNRSEHTALYEEEMHDDLVSKVYNNEIDNFVICKGHSHPPIGIFCEDFSLGDLAGDIQFNEANPIFKEEKIELVSCVVTPSQDINFLYYDDKSENFYRFGKVLIKNKNNMYSRINCYGDGEQNIQERHR